MGIKLWRDLKPVYAVDELVAPVCQRCPKPRHLRRCDVDADGPTVTRLRLGVRPDAIVTGQAQVRGSADLAYGNRICATGQNGRASCRERVCPAVEISVDAGSLTTKPAHKTLVT